MPSGRTKNVSVWPSGRRSVLTSRPPRRKRSAFVVPDHDPVALLDDDAVAGLLDHAPPIRLDPLLARLLHILEARRRPCRWSGPRLNAAAPGPAGPAWARTSSASAAHALCGTFGPGGVPNPGGGGWLTGYDPASAAPSSSGSARAPSSVSKGCSVALRAGGSKLFAAGGGPPGGGPEGTAERSVPSAAWDLSPAA